MPSPRLVVLSAVLVAGGCAHGIRGGAGGGRAHPASVFESSRAILPQVTGVWDWVFRSNDDQGNLRVEQEEWHLVQRGSRIEGYYDRALTLLSLDDHLFRCNQQLGITKFTRVRVAGSIEGNHVRVQEVGYDARPSPCDDGARSLNRYIGELKDSTMRLEWAERQGDQTLYRRQREGGPRLAEMVGLEDRPPPELGRGGTFERHPGVPIHGIFSWDLKTVDAEGDERVEHEEWHLDEKDGDLHGYYDRKVMHVRDAGVFKCGQPSYETRVRVDVDGHRTGDTLVLKEMSYHAESNPCDSRVPRLDTYQGSISATGNEIVLLWGSANQVLRRQPAAP